MPTAKLGLKDFSRKVRTLWHCSRLRSVALYLWLIVVISVRQSTVAAISGLHCRALVMVSSEHKADSLIAKFKEAGGTVRDWCMSRVTAIISALVICIIVCLSWAVNHYRDNAITYKAARQKCQRTEAGERGNYWHADASASDVAALDAKHEGVSVLKLKMMLCVMMLPLVVVGCTSKRSVSQCVKATTASGVDVPASPRLANAELELFHPQRRRPDPAKTTGRNPEVY